MWMNQIIIKIIIVFGVSIVNQIYFNKVQPKYVVRTYVFEKRVQTVTFKT